MTRGPRRMTRRRSRLGWDTSLRAAGASLLAALTLTACSDSDPSPVAPPAPEPPPESPPAPAVVERLTVAPAASPLARRLEVRLTAPDGVRAVYTTPDGEALAVTVEEAVAEHDVALARLLADTEYEVAVLPLSADSTVQPTRATFRTDPLPEPLAVLSFPAEGTPTSPLTLLEISLNGRGEEGWIGPTIVDARGRVVWYTDAPGSVSDATRRANGNFVIQTGIGLREVTPTGEVAAWLPEAPPYDTIHHDVVATPRNTVIFLAQDARPVAGDTVVSGEAVWEWDPDAGTDPVKLWSAWSDLSWEADQGWNSMPNDWLHANALWLGPSGNVLASFAWLDQIVSIAPDFGSLEWRLGAPPNATVAPPADGTFHFQHSATELPASVPGRRRILLFDNGAEDRAYSRALELELDPAAGTAEKVWEWVAPNRNKSQIVSLARRLPNGNTFVTFGAKEPLFGSKGPVEVYEVAPDGSVVWRLEVTGEGMLDPFALYRATPVSDLVGEVEVEGGG